MRKNSEIALAALVLGLAVLAAAAPVEAQNPGGPQLHSLFYNDIGATGSTADFFQAVVQSTGTGIAPGTGFGLDYLSPDTHNDHCLSGHGAGPSCLLETLNVSSPEPGTMALLGSGLLSLAGAGIVRRRRRA